MTRFPPVLRARRASTSPLHLRAERLRTDLFRARRKE
jgi:hypothetical protein